MALRRSIVGHYSFRETQIPQFPKGKKRFSEGEIGTFNVLIWSFSKNWICCRRLSTQSALWCTFVQLAKMIVYCIVVKCRVAPIRTSTKQKLEFQAIPNRMHLCTAVRKLLPFEIETLFWCNFATILHCRNSSHKNLQVLFSNRVAECSIILQLNNGGSLSVSWTIPTLPPK